jgi:hypothetical protein
MTKKTVPAALGDYVEEDEEQRPTTIPCMDPKVPKPYPRRCSRVTKTLSSKNTMNKRRRGKNPGRSAEGPTAPKGEEEEGGG